MIEIGDILPEFNLDDTLGNEFSSKNKILGKNSNISDVSIFSDGSSIYVLTDNDQMIDLLKKGQAVFGISLGPVHTETEAEILSLYPDKVSAANR